MTNMPLMLMALNLVLCLYPKCGLEPDHSSAGWNLLKVGGKGRTWADGSHFGGPCLFSCKHVTSSIPFVTLSAQRFAKFQWFHRSTSYTVFLDLTNLLITMWQNYLILFTEFIMFYRAFDLSFVSCGVMQRNHHI